MVHPDRRHCPRRPEAFPESVTISKSRRPSWPQRCASLPGMGRKWEQMDRLPEPCCPGVFRLDFQQQPPSLGCRKGEGSPQQGLRSIGWLGDHAELQPRLIQDVGHHLCVGYRISPEFTEERTDIGVHIVLLRKDADRPLGHLRELSVQLVRADLAACQSPLPPGEGPVASRGLNRLSCQR